jgi:hypothetical protein
MVSYATDNYGQQNASHYLDNNWFTIDIYNCCYIL